MHVHVCTAAIHEIASRTPTDLRARVGLAIRDHASFIATTMSSIYDFRPDPDHRALAAHARSHDAAEIVRDVWEKGQHPSHDDLRARLGARPDYLTATRMQFAWEALDPADRAGLHVAALKAKHAVVSESVEDEIDYILRLFDSAAALERDLAAISGGDGE